MSAREERIRNGYRVAVVERLDHPGGSEFVVYVNESRLDDDPNLTAGQIVIRDAKRPAGSVVGGFHDDTTAIDAEYT